MADAFVGPQTSAGATSAVSWSVPVPGGSPEIRGATQGTTIAVDESSGGESRPGELNPAWYDGLRRVGAKCWGS